MPHLPSSIFYLLPLAGYWLVLIYYLGAQWSVYEQYHYGWAVPFLCAYLLWRRVTQASQPPSSAGVPAAADTPSPAGEVIGQRSGVHLLSTIYHLPSTIFYLLLALCAFLYAPTRFLHEANPIWRLTSLLWTLEVIGLTLLTMHLVHGQMTEIRGQKPQVSGPSSIFHLPSSRALAFPLCFFLVAVPWPSGLEHFLTQSLLRLNTSTTVELLGFFGIPAVQHGSVIEVSTGVVGVDEACSGIRSLQATLMISLFLGELYALSAWRRALCVVAGFALAFAFNLGRTLLLTRVAAAKGVGAVAAWHDPAGVTILVACFLCLWLIARVLRKAEISSPVVPSSRRPVVPSSVHPPQLCPPSAVVLRRTGYGGRVVSWSLLGWLLVVEAGTELWYHSHERATAGSAEWSVHRPDQSSTYTEVEIPPGISGQFRYDEGTQGRWQDGSGHSWQLYYFRWFPAHSLQKRVAIQLAKTHGPETCLPAVGMKESAYLGIITLPVAGMDLAMQQYVFNAEGTPLHVFYGIYEDPSGSSKLANRRKDIRSRVAAALAGSRNYGQRFLEVAVVGYERPEEAKAALGRELEKLIEVRK
jgi:exosortase/archaeosortase family protein